MMIRKLSLAAVIILSLILFPAQAEETVPEETPESLIEDTEPETSEDIPQENETEAAEEPPPDHTADDPPVPETDPQTQQQAQGTEEESGNTEADEMQNEASDETSSSADAKNPEVPSDPDMDQSNGDSIDLHETTAHAAARILRQEKQQESGTADPLIQTDEGVLVSKGKIASFDSVINEGRVEFIKLYFIHDRPVYCVQPEVNLKLINGIGGTYHGKTWDSIDTDTRNLLKRISYFGYGFEPIGTSNTAYAATQLLIWKTVSQNYYEKINQSLRMCPGIQEDFTACDVPREELNSCMDRIMDYVDHYDTVPSFAGSDHSVRSYALDWGETLDLNDGNNVLSWFAPEEKLPGLRTEIRDNHLLVRFTDPYQADADSLSGTSIRFARKKEQWENMQNGLLLYEQGDQQKLMAASGEDPSPGFTLSFRLNTADVQLFKTDEYGDQGPYCSGTMFVLGWKEDPSGSGQSDPDGMSGEKESFGLRYPLYESDGKTIRIFETDSEGKALLRNLPASSVFWLKEVRTGDAFEKEAAPSLLRAGTAGESTDYVYANRLRNVSLEITKQDGDQVSEKLNDAHFVLYEIGDHLNLSKEPVSPGLSLKKQEQAPSLTFSQLKEHSSLQKGDCFEFNHYFFEITDVSDQSYSLRAVRIDDHGAGKGALSRYSLPASLNPGDTAELTETSSFRAGIHDADGESVRVTVSDVNREEETVRVIRKDSEGERRITVDLKEERPVWADIPDGRILKPGDTFVLSWPMIESDGSFSRGELEFTVRINGPHFMKITSGSEEYVISAPSFITAEDLPETGTGIRSVQVLSVRQPYYEAEDDRGNHYLIKEDGTEVTDSSGGGLSTDISWQEISGSADGVCVNPADVRGCPAGTVRRKELLKTETVKYTGPQYRDLSEEEKRRPAGEWIVREEDRYLICSNDGISMTVAMPQNGKQYLAELTDGSAETAVYTERVPVTFTVVKRYDKDISVSDGGGAVNLSKENQAELLAAYLRKEEETGVLFAAGDTAEFEMEHPLKENDTFVLGPRKYTVEDMTEGITLFYAWDDDDPFTAAEIQNSNGTIEKDGTVYEVREESMPGYAAVLITDHKTVYTWIRETLKETAQKAEMFRIAVKRPAEVLFEELQAARYGAKRKGQHITVNDAVYEIAEAKTQGSVSRYVLKDQKNQLHEIPDKNGLELPVTIERIESLPCDLAEKDEITVKGETYLIVRNSAEPGCGRTVLLKRISDGKKITVHENPDPGSYETETLLVLRTGEKRVLTAAGKEGGFRLRTLNSHIIISRENGEWTIESDANTTAVLETLNKEGEVTAVRRVIFSSKLEEGERTALPLFAGSTGHSNLRILDRDRHNMPVSGAEVEFFRDQNMKDTVLKAVSDSYGVIDLSGLQPGTYWYRDPETGEIKNTSVLSEGLRKGQLEIGDLKWGRTYLLLEDAVPDGYDFAEEEAVRMIRTEAEQGKERFREIVENSLRSLLVEVYKVDQDNNRTPLSNAWFTAEDVTDLETSRKDKEGSSDPEKVTVENIPAGAEAGDVFPVWPFRENGTRRFWRIEHVREDGVEIALLENGKFDRTFFIPKRGYDSAAPLLYIDIVHAVGTPLEKAVFETPEKEAAASIRFYRILSIETEPAKDVFGHYTEQMTVRSAVVEDADDSMHTPISLKTFETADYIGSHPIGEFISGGILIRRTEEIPKLPAVIQDLRRAGVRSSGEVIPVYLRRTADMPDYETIRTAVQNGRKSLESEGLVWNVSAEENGVFRINAKDQSFLFYPQTISGAISWYEETAVLVTDCQFRNQQLSSAVIRDSAGNSWYLSEETVQETVTEGKPGIEVAVQENESGTRWHGYTGRDGRFVLPELPDGEYTVETEGERYVTRVEKGKVFLPSIRYGRLIRICETKSPLGYLRGNACAVLQPKTEYGVDTVTNTRTNAKIVTREEELRKIVKVRKMGEASDSTGRILRNKDGEEDMRMKKIPAVILCVSAAAIAAGILCAIRKPSAAAELFHAEYSRADEYVSEPDEEPENLEAWKKINPNVKYVLTFSDEEGRRTIPVIAAGSDSYVMNHNVRGEYDTMGSVFCDPSASEPENLVIYGHSSRTKDWNFTFFKNYADPQYYRKHPSILLESDSGLTPCRIISLASYDLEKDEYVGWADSTISGTGEISEMIQNTMKNLIQHTDGFVYQGGGILTLVTCDMDRKDSRYVIQAARSPSA